MDMLKSQILTITAMKGGNSQNDNGIMNAVYGIMLLSLVEQIFKYLPFIGAFIKKYSEEYFKKKYRSMNIINTISTMSNLETSSIILERSYGEKDNNANSEYVESILDYVSKLPNIKYLKYRNRFFVSHKDEFTIEDNIFGKCLEIVENPESGELERITFQIKSNKLDIQQLRTYLNNIYKNYIISKKNQLGDQTYFFDHIIHLNNNIQIMRFDMTPFNTNKSLKTIYGSYMINVIQRINFFIKNKDWYIKKGIPHTLGLLLHGPPGCGKTSLIKAIANDTSRHIINIQLNKSLTQTQLKTLFFSDEICVYNKKTNQNELFIIPLDKRIYVMEDVDAISDILYSRNITNEKKELEDKIRKEAYEEAKRAAIAKGYAPPPPPNNGSENKEEITLAFFLNLLDGILETPGRIVILTSNHPEKLDEALVRPGRIDINIHFDRCSRETVVELVEKFYENIHTGSVEWTNFLIEIDRLEEFMLTPAEVNKVIFNYYNNYIAAIKEIIICIKEKVSIEDNKKDLVQILEPLVDTQVKIIENKSEESPKENQYLVNYKPSINERLCELKESRNNVTGIFTKKLENLENYSALGFSELKQ
jgi:DNA polymerase III delta prime subunit